MKAVDITIQAPAPRREAERTLEHSFIEGATRAGAINTRIQKTASHWTFVAEFLDTEKAALYAARLTKVTGERITAVALKPTTNYSES